MTKQNRIPKWSLATGALAMLLVVGPVSQSSAQDKPLTESLARMVDEPERLVEKVTDDGLARVIIILRTEEKAGEDEETAIAVAQDAFLSVFLPKTESTARRDERGIHRFGAMPFVALNVDVGDLKRLSENPLVERIELSIELKPLLTDSVPAIGGAKVHSKKATGKGTMVVIIDTGVEVSHPFLGGRVTEEACFSTSMANRWGSLCADGKNKQTGKGSIKTCRGMRGCNHGTHVAGIAAGSGEAKDGSKITGVAPEANIMAIQVFSKYLPRKAISAQSADLLAALDYVILKSKTMPEIVSINASLGRAFRGDSKCDTSNKAITLAIDKLRKQNIAPVFASGNDYTKKSTGWPACIDSSIAVGATNKSRKVAKYSNMGSMVDLMAPGGIGGAVKGRAAKHIQSSVFDGKFGVMSGTSMAAPHVAGAFAAIRSIRPNATIDQIEKALKKSGLVIKDHRDGAVYSVPMIQIDKAIEELDRGAATAGGDVDDVVKAASGGGSTDTDGLTDSQMNTLLRSD